MFHIFYATPPSPNLFTQMASMPKWQNHSSCLVLCFACYYSYHCTAAGQKPNMIAMKANCSVMFPDGMKWTCIQETSTHPINIPLSDDGHQHTHTSRYSSHGIPANHQTVPCRVLWQTTWGWRRRGGGFCCRTNNWLHAHHRSDSHVIQCNQKQQSDYIKAQVLR